MVHTSSQPWIWHIALLPLSLTKYWNEDGCKQEALILMKKNLTFIGHYSMSYSCVWRFSFEKRGDRRKPSLSLSCFIEFRDKKVGWWAIWAYLIEQFGVTTGKGSRPAIYRLSRVRRRVVYKHWPLTHTSRRRCQRPSFQRAVVRVGVVTTTRVMWVMRVAHVPGVEYSRVVVAHRLNWRRLVPSEPLFRYILWMRAWNMIEMNHPCYKASWFGPKSQSHANWTPLVWFTNPLP